jgi:hypothetical protein
MIRYSDPFNASSQLFGISLYQQKVNELGMEGRRPFSAHEKLADEGQQHPTTPYLSPVPCSWGAVYFPEQWRVFHRYLSERLLETQIKLGDVVAPEVRSNHWTKSWKKYFIELAYLRGWVMLYPNYSNFSSLSTNHLEIGSHVKARTIDKKTMFLLPLINAPKSSNERCPLLELPGGVLPPFRALPVFNLTGSTTTLDKLRNQGQQRCNELNWCRI